MKNIIFCSVLFCSIDSFGCGCCERICKCFKGNERGCGENEFLDQFFVSFYKYVGKLNEENPGFFLLDGKQEVILYINQESKEVLFFHRNKAKITDALESGIFYYNRPFEKLGKLFDVLSFIREAFSIDTSAIFSLCFVDSTKTFLFSGKNANLLIIEDKITVFETSSPFKEHSLCWKKNHSSCSEDFFFSGNINFLDESDHKLFALCLECGSFWVDNEEIWDEEQKKNFQKKFLNWLSDNYNIMYECTTGKGSADLFKNIYGNEKFLCFLSFYSSKFNRSFPGYLFSKPLYLSLKKTWNL